MGKVWIVLCLCLLLSVEGRAQTFPSKPIRLIVPVAAGGNQEITARAVAEEMSKGLGQQIIVESRPSSSALVGTQLVAHAAPDGYTLLSVSTTFARAPVLAAAAGYDPVRDFIGVSLISRIPLVLVVNPATPVKSVAELIALAKAKPGELSYASSGLGSTGHVAQEVFNRMAGIRMLHVPYKGNAQALVDVLGGQVPVMFDQMSTSLPQIKAGKLRALGVSSRARSPLLPEVPTIDEQGLKGFEEVTWNAIPAPAGPPREIVARLHREVVRAVAVRELRSRYLERAIELTSSASPEELTAFVKDEVAAFSRLAKETGLKAE